MKPKQNKNYIVGIYARLSRDDERAGESLSIENQKTMLTKYVREQGWTLHDVYIDDGVSGTTFEREGVQRLLDDAKAGIINLIIVKDLSRFGRNYIQVGQFLDYVFPAFGIRFIALSDNVDTADKDTTAMDMMPITNVFNEWYASNTSKKIRAVHYANAKVGRNNMSHAPFGYLIGDDEKRSLVVDEEAAPIVKRIFDLRAQGYRPGQIAIMFNDENIITPHDYKVKKFNGKYSSAKVFHLWSSVAVSRILKNPAYIGNLALHRMTTVSYKNHKSIYRPEDEWAVTENAHPAIIEKELWDKVREAEASVSQGKRTKHGFTHPLSGLMFCADCGGKMKLSWGYSNIKKGPKRVVYDYNCGNRMRLGKSYCFSHYISASDIEVILLADIREKAKLVLDDEAEIRRKFAERNRMLEESRYAEAKRELADKKKRVAALEKLIEAAYEDKVIGKIPEDFA
ncbi:MAG: recombinase family protein [Corallococcus sp.]|nr:recombinase family protein [Corallococcus sp.]